MNKEIPVGITDITSSEGNLKRYSKICKLIKSQRALKRNKIIEIVKNTGLTNDKVIGRHIDILQKIKLLENIGGVYILSSEGKSLCELIDKNTNKLGLNEKFFYFKQLFTTETLDQLVTLLETIIENKHKPRKEIILAYFNTNFAQRVWNKITIQKNLRIFKEKRIISRFFENKFRCMEMWLLQLDILEKKRNHLQVTLIGSTALAKIKKYEKELNDKIYEVISVLLTNQIKKFDYEQDKNIFIKLFKKAYFLFKVQSNISDIKAIQSFVCINLLTERLLLEEKEFNEVIQKLWKEEIIRSVMPGRDGKPAYVVLPSKS